ncbi:RAMP superfamily CRISPR-associated protein [Almyronema epifaneia]|uniref:RAMP superfamily CRISPR-associated protein n=1 Tax=Almyronema epifaneia S1 TaxID=2991925 RepID=A0ABW6IKH3_9CYAN
MNQAPKTATLLVDLLARQHETRSPHLFRRGTFTLVWRAKVGSTPFPNLETIISAAEPCGRFDWRSQRNADRFEYNRQPPENEKTEATPEYFGNLSDLANRNRYLKLNGYIPGSAIRGIVRSWALQRSDSRNDAIRLLGKQDSDSDKVTPGKIVFLDAWPQEPQPLSLDIVNPQQDFQVYHLPQGSTPQACNPQALYTLGNGSQPLKCMVAIRAIPDSTRSVEEIEHDLDTVWDWVKQALSLHGVGSRTASGYGAMNAPRPPQAKPVLPDPDPGYIRQRFVFDLYSQGCYGVDKDNRNNPELRPSHWRGWLRSWTLRFLLGVLPKEQAELALANLFGTIEPQAHKGCVRIKMHKGKIWGDRSDKSPYFYVWKGQLEVSAPPEVLTAIILPIMRVAVTLGGVGHGWRRPLHIFYMDNNRPAARGCCLTLKTRGSDSTKIGDELTLPLNTDWSQLYETWRTRAQAYFRNQGLRFEENPNRALDAEIFSPRRCAVYALLGPLTNPVNEGGSNWSLDNNQVTFQSAEDTRGDGVWLIYQDRYKRNPDVGGDAGRGSASCSWVSIRRVNVPHPTIEADCQEMVCLFLGGQGEQGFQRDRYRFLRDLEEMEDSNYLFGVHTCR